MTIFSQYFTKRCISITYSVLKTDLTSTSDDPLSDRIEEVELLRSLRTALTVVTGVFDIVKRCGVSGVP